jgi:hypothetical protein
MARRKIRYWMETDIPSSNLRTLRETAHHKHYCAALATSTVLEVPKFYLSSQLLVLALMKTSLAGDIIDKIDYLAKGVSTTDPEDAW